MLITRVHRVFLRYAETALVLDAPGGALADGAVTQVQLAGMRLIVAGHARADRVGLQFGSRLVWVAPVAQDGRFCFDVPFEAGPFDILTERAGVRHSTLFAGIPAARVTRARRALTAPFLARLMQLAPQIWRWRRHGDTGAREAVKEGLGLVPRSFAATLDPGLLTPAPAAPPPFARITLVMPVHNALALTQEALERVARHTDLDWRLILIDDASTEPGLADWLESWAAAQGDRVHLLVNPVNEGFVASVNRGVARARDWPDDPVILLNSDALVPAGWASRLTAPLADASVASVTPLSNDAEIFTVPVLCQRHDLQPGQGDALDVIAAGLGQDTAASAPTGVGFCMALAPRFLAQVPGFDPVFAPGYGEEADWCQKTRALGGRHLCATTLFVEHRGGASFGSAAKQKLLARNGAEISRRYPAYDDEVQRFLRDDPLTTSRLALGLGWAGLRGEVPVYLAHAMGGGAERWLQDRIAQEGVAVVLRVGQAARWKLELHTPQGVTAGLSEETGVIRALIARLPRRRIIYSCGVGVRDGLDLPGVLLDLAAEDHPVELLIHDFFPISPSYTLLGQNSVYTGLPAVDTGDPAHHWRPGVPLSDWQAAWAPLMARAGQITVFSPSSRDLVAAAYPQAGPIVLRPHALRQDVPRIAVPDGPPVIGVLGNIGPHKGAGLLEALSRDLAASGAARLVVIGRLAPEYSLTPPAAVHGSYRMTDLPGLVARYGIQVWLIPSIWPETFSFTTHEALATGMPVLAFDLGAQGDAVRAAPNGHVLPVPGAEGLDPAALLAVLREVELS